MSRYYWNTKEEDQLRAEIDLESCSKVFVYGTLKRGWGNNTLLTGAEFKGEATLKGEYFMPVGRGAPGLLPAQPNTTNRPVLGEVYKVLDADQFMNLDGLEGHPWGYYRSIRKTTLGRAWVYFYPWSRDYTDADAEKTKGGAFVWG